MSDLKRDLGLLSMTALAVSMMLGSGIFFGPALTAQQFPDATIVLSLWALGGAIAFVGAWVFGRLSARFPLSGGPYAYLRASFGPYTAFLYAWTSFVIIAPTSAAVIATLLAQNVGVLTPLSPVAVKLLASAALAAFALVNLASVKMGGAAQSALSILKVVLVLGLIVVLAFVAGGLGSSAPTAPPPAAPGKWSLAFVGILFAYGGWDYAVLAGEEVRDAKRNILRGLVLGVLIVTVLYMASVWGYLQALGAAGVAAAGALAPTVAMARAFPAAASLVAIAVAISAAGTINAIMLLGPRATFAVTRDGDVRLPAWLGRVSARGVPAAAIVLQTGMALAYVWIGAFDVVAAFTVLGVGVFVLLSAVGLLLLKDKRWRDVESYAALVIALVYAWFLVDLVIEAPRIARDGIGLIMAGTLLYAAGAWSAKRHAQTVATRSNAP